MGVWIEIFFQTFSDSLICVAPFVGVWIEISNTVSQSLHRTVAPFVGVWIEIFKRYIIFITLLSRSLRGSVD